MTKKLYHITVFFDSFNQERDLSSAFDSADDWLRYAPNCWFVATEEDVAVWLDRLRKITGMGGNILLIEITSPDLLDGLLRRSNWDWLRKHGLKIDTQEPPSLL